MTSQSTSLPKARRQLAAWQAEADTMHRDDLCLCLRELKLPPEIATGLETLADVAQPLGGRMVSIGKVTVLRLVEFVEAHRGIAIGSLLGAAVATMASASIPVLGALMAPLVVPIALAIGAAGSPRRNEATDTAPTPAADMDAAPRVHDLVETAHDFFRPFVEVIATLWAEAVSMRHEPAA